MRYILIVVCVLALLSGCKPTDKKEPAASEIPTPTSVPTSAPTSAPDPAPEAAPQSAEPEVSTPLCTVESPDGGIPQTADAFEKAFQRANGMAEKGDIEGASRAFQLMTQDFPDRYEPYHRLALIVEREGDEDTATALYEEALRRRPKDAAFFNDYGWYLLTLQKYSEAHTLLYQAVNLDGQEKKYQNNLACCLAFERRYDEAFMMYKKSANGNSAEAHLNLARNQILLEDAEATRTNLQKALVFDSENSEAKRLLKVLDESQAQPAPEVSAEE